ncbi:MAG: hypothetical protein QOE24_1988, partial [Frankiales bacterium]|nr:hypothetical protein [Frankiales bacterium]
MTQDAPPVATGAVEPVTGTLAPETAAPEPHADAAPDKARPHRTRVTDVPAPVDHEPAAAEYPAATGSRTMRSRLAPRGNSSRTTNPPVLV